MSNEPTLYIVTGDKDHGKDTVCEYLRDVHGWDFRGSSWVFCKHIMFDRIKDSHGYTSIEQCYADRDNHRALWFDAIAEFNADNPARLGEMIFAEAPIYCGIRSRREFEGVKQRFPRVITIWVDASRRRPPESKKSMELTVADADWVVDNNGSPSELHRQLDQLASRMKAVA